MRFIILGTLLIGNLLAAQASRFVYDVQMKTDSTNKSDSKVETVYLDTDGKKSLFISERALQRDSLMMRNRQTGVRPDFSQMQNFRSIINYTISKDYEKEETLYNGRIGRDMYTYVETAELPWQITGETAKLDDYTTQKALVHFGGRLWEAWFTTAIPISDGPYIFKGLPGLIVKLEDSKGDYIFQLTKTKKLAEMSKEERMGQPIKVKKSDYVKTEKRFKQDPEEFMRSSMSSGRPAPPMGNVSGGSGGRRGQGGGMSPRMDSEQMKNMRSMMVKELKAYNNPIELK